MKTEKNTAQNTETVEEFDDELLYAEDDKGNRIPDEDVGLIATTPKIVEFRAQGEKHRVEILFSQISFETRRRPGQIAQKISLEHGILDDDDAKSNPELAAEVNRLITENPDYQKSRVNVVLEAVKRDSKGRLRLTIPLLREAADKDLVALLNGDENDPDTIYATRFVNAVMEEVNDFFIG